jgi:uncharacterized membrane protein
MASRYPVNRSMVDEAPLGSRIADRVTGFMGRWRFIPRPTGSEDAGQPPRE